MVELDRYILVDFMDLPRGSKFIFSMRDRVEYIKTSHGIFSTPQHKEDLDSRLRYTVIEGQKVFVKY